MRHYFSVVLVGLLVVAGCGGDDHNGRLPDAPPGSTDAPVDAPVDVPTDVPDQPLPVALTVMLNGAPQVGVHTYFLNADSSPVATLDTDASGTVTAVMAPGGSVTAIDPFARALAVRKPGEAAVIVGTNDVRTFLGVKPGDHLVLTQNDDITVTFLASTDPQQPQANVFDLQTTCGGGTLAAGGGSGSGGGISGTVTLHACQGGVADVMVVARQVVGEVPDVTLSALVHQSVAIHDGDTIDLSSDTYQSLSTDSGATFTYMGTVGIPLTVSHALVTARGAFSPFVADATSGSVTITEPTIAGATSIVDTDVDHGLIAQHHVVDWGPFAAEYTLDFGGDLLLPSFVGNPSYNFTSQQLGWTEEPTGAKPDLTTAKLEVVRGGGARTWHWTIAAPYTPGVVRFPTLPNDVADWTPSLDTDCVAITDLMNAKVPGGYEAARARIHDVHDAVSNGDFTGVATGTSGRVVAIQLPLNDRCLQEIQRPGSRVAPRPGRHVPPPVRSAGRTGRR